MVKNNLLKNIINIQNIRRMKIVSAKIYVVGETTPFEVTIASTEQPMMLDQYVVIEDKILGNIIGEIIETKSLPKVNENTFSNSSQIYTSLKEINMDKAEILYLSKVKMIESLSLPVTPLSSVRMATFEEVSPFLVKKMPNEGLTIGVFQGTEHLQEQLPEPLRNVSPLFENGLKEQKGVPFVFDFYKMQEYPHIAIIGNSGSGKTFGLRVICEELMTKRIPGIVLDPHYEFTFSRKVDGYPSESFTDCYEVFEIGRDVGVDFTEITTEELISLLNFEAKLSPQMYGALEHLHEKNDSFHTLEKRLEDLIEAFEYYESPDYKRDGDLDEAKVLLYNRLKHKVAGLPTLKALIWRLEQIKKTGIFTLDASPIKQALFKRKLAVIRGKGHLLRMFSSYVIRKAYYKRRNYRDYEQRNLNQKKTGFVPEKFPPFVVIADEAHIFAPKEGSTPMKSLLQEIGQEARKYGVFLVLGTQSPSLMDKGIVSQMNTKFIFRINEQSDMAMIKTETNLTEAQAKRLPDMTVGHAFVSSPILGRTMTMRFRSTKTLSPHKDHPFDELDGFGVNDKLKSILKEMLPVSTNKLPRIHSEINEKMGTAVSIGEITETLENMALAGEAQKEESVMGVKYFPN